MPDQTTSEAELLWRAGATVTPAAQAWGQARLGVQRVLASSATPVEIYGNGTEFTVGSKSITCVPNSILRVSGLCNFALPNTGGRAIYVKIGGILVAQSFPTATLGGFRWETTIHIRPDGKTCVLLSQNLNNVLSPTNGQGTTNVAQTNVPTVLSAIDFNVANTLAITLVPASGDRAILESWEATLTPCPVENIAPANALACWGDSLTNGTGATTTGGWPSLLRIALPGRPVTNLGIGNETSLKIKNRVLADTICGKYWRSIFWMGRNDVGGNLTTTAIPNIAAAVANLASGTKYMVLSITPSTTDTAGLKSDIIAANATLSSTYGANYCDIHSLLVDGSNGTNIAAGYLSDAVHLNEAGYTVVKNAVLSKLTALSM